MRLFTLQLVASVRRMSLLNKLIRSFPSSLLHGRRSQDALIVVSPKQHDGNQGLATELLVEILSYLGHRDLIRCRRVSSAFQQVIDGTPFLQYIVEFGVAGCTPGYSVNAGMTVSQRLRAFRAIQCTWRDPHPRCECSEYVLLPNSSAWNGRTSLAFGDILIGTVRGDRSGELLHILNLEAGPNSLRTPRFLDRILKFVADGEQDLLVLFSWTNVRFISLSKSPEPHKRAAKEFINIGFYMSALHPAEIRSVAVSGDWVLLTTFRKGRSSFLLCHWPSGEILLKQSHSDVLSHNAHLVNGYLTICQNVLDPIFCRVVTTLEVYSPKIGHQTTNQVQIHPIARLEVPPVTLLSPNARHPVLRHIPSSASPGLVCLSLDGGCSGEWDLYVPLATVLSNVSSHTGTSFYVPWDAWGPFTRLASNKEPQAIINLRVVFNDMIWDFNPIDITRNIYAPDVVSPDVDGGVVHSKPTTLPTNANGKWSIPSYPYRETKLHLPRAGTHSGAWFKQSIFQDEVSGPKVARVFFEEHHPRRLEIISL